jgi:hypothetical protein
MPGLFLVLKRLQDHFGIRKVRTTWNIFSPKKSPSWLHILRKRLWNSALRYYHSTTTTAGFTSFATFYEVAKSSRLNLESVELMVHPGHRQFEWETQLLNREWQEDILSTTNLISYHDL